MSLLPPELYREIATNLRAPTHRSELLSLSLVSKFWSNESQRILFRRFCHLGHTDTDEESERDRKVHIQFLRTILEHPQRLGRYIESYAQCGLACDRQSVSDARYSEADWKMEIYLWDLTKKALPVMVNLKHLVFDPALWRASASNTLLTGCSFQLEMISWGCDKDVLDLCSRFLPSQHNLLHLDIGRCPGGTTLLELPLAACPKLSSVLCNFQSMCHVAESRSIKALKMSKNHFGQNALQPLLRHSPALDRVQYLSLWNYTLFRQFVGSCAINLVLLELLYWKGETVQSLSHLPRIRILSLLDCEDLNDDLRSHPVLAVQSFKKFITLKTVIIRDWVLDNSRSQCTRYTISGEGGRGNITVESVLSEVVVHRRDPDTLWWTVYEDDLLG